MFSNKFHVLDIVRLSADILKPNTSAAWVGLSIALIYFLTQIHVVMARHDQSSFHWQHPRCEGAILYCWSGWDSSFKVTVDAAIVLEEARLTFPPALQFVVDSVELRHPSASSQNSCDFDATFKANYYSKRVFTWRIRIWYLARYAWWQWMHTSMVTAKSLLFSKKHNTVPSMDSCHRTA